jgi:tRNA A-37 threonylcarbamoyl transferase component Bud32
MQHGLGHQGIVPRYHGEIQHLDVKDYQPHLRRFLDEERPPSAIFLEYIPNMVTILPEHYTKERVESMMRGIRQIHKALVLHFDSYPRNIKVFENDPEQVIWIDFDRVQTYDADTITERNKTLIEEEEEDVHLFAESLVSSAPTMITYSSRLL